VELAVLLQPRDTFYWDNGAWHLAWNASIDAQNNPAREPLERQIDSMRWVEAGRDLLERGVQAIPEKPILHQRLGDLYWHRLQDFDSAAERYREAISKPGAPEYLDRFVGYALQKAGRPQEAYDYFKELWNKRAPEDLPVRWERVERELRKLEEELNLPDDQRLFPKGSDQKAMK
jgi:tetratricopeptide (TPR) repeat protein